MSEVRREGKRIGLVASMGNLHAAHLALVRQAQATCDCVVVCIFVNRLQFGLNEDWDKYPRTLNEDTAKLAAIGCDFLFCPEETEIDRKSTRLNSSHVAISYAVFCLKKKNNR